MLQKYEFDYKLELLFYLYHEKDGTPLTRLVITEDVFQECHPAKFSGHAGRDNTLQRMKQRYYWPDY